MRGAVVLWPPRDWFPAQERACGRVGWRLHAPTHLGWFCFHRRSPRPRAARGGGGSSSAFGPRHPAHFPALFQLDDGHRLQRSANLVSFSDCCTLLIAGHTPTSLLPGGGGCSWHVVQAVHVAAGGTCAPVLCSPRSRAGAAALARHAPRSPSIACLLTQRPPLVNHAHDDANPQVFHTCCKLRERAVAGHVSTLQSGAMAHASWACSSCGTNPRFR